MKFAGGVCLLILLVLPLQVQALSTLFYDPPTGEIFFDVQGPGGRFTGFDLRSQAGLLQTDNFLRLGEPTVLLHVTSTYLTDAAGLGTDRPDGLYGIGAVYPQNVSAADFVADVSASWGSDATGVVDFAIEFGRPAGIPRNDPNLMRIHGSWAETATLRYVAPTGELVLDTSGEDGGYLGYFAIESFQRFRNDNAVAPQIDVWESGESTLAGIGLLAPGEHNLGAVLDIGLSPDEFTAAISSARWRGETGVGFGEFDLTLASGSNAMTLVHIPEPASVGMLILGMAVCCCRSRMRSRTATSPTSASGAACRISHSQSLTSQFPRP